MNIDDIRAIATLQQLAPIPNDAPSCHDLAVEAILARKEVGLQNYGRPLQAHNGRNQLAEKLQEQIDQLVYTIADIQEREALLRRMEKLEAIADLVKDMIREAEMDKLPPGPVDLFVDVRWFRDLQSAIAAAEEGRC
ncbi:MAG TPA: hypothetical protein V6C63_21460 [Allocoleopsis sp.]